MGSIPTGGALEVWPWTLGSRTAWLVNKSAGQPQFNMLSLSAGHIRGKEEINALWYIDVFFIDEEGQTAIKIPVHLHHILLGPKSKGVDGSVSMTITGSPSPLQTQNLCGGKDSHSGHGGKSSKHESHQYLHEDILHKE